MAYWVTEQIAVSGATISSDNWRDLVEKLNVTAVVNLRTEYQDTFVHPLPVGYLWLPVVDFTDPSPEQLALGAQFIDAAVKTGQRVLIHCKMGIGRSPTMTAAYLVWTGMPVKDAIRQVKASPRQSYGYRPVINRATLERFVDFLQAKGIKNVTQRRGDADRT